jgi:hypothetical protein
MSSAYNYSLPPTAVCPGCGAVVVLPKEPLFPDSPPAICGTCESEVPDYRRESFDPTTQPAPVTRQLPPIPHQPAPAPAQPLEKRVYTRGGLFKSLGGIIAERAEGALESAKDHFPG